MNRRRYIREIRIGILALILTGCMGFEAHTQYDQKDRPNLVVSIVVDQMRYDYLTRYWEKFGDDGFKRLIQEGYFFENAHYDYAPTYTAPGHASISTGTTPAVHGIIGNSWFDKVSGQTIYCAGDTSVTTLGSDSDAGEMSPRNMLSTTLADQMKLASNFRNKSIGISIKDRGAILPAGHSADLALWYDGKNGKWVSSSFYGNSLPQWVQEYNDSGEVEKMLSGSWTPLLPIEEYVESIPDANPFERPYSKGSLPVFPYDLSELKEQHGTGLIRATPFGNTMTIDVAKRAVLNENLGRGDFTDFLSISFSSTDYIGHQFGPRSIEIQDTYLRLDRELAELLTFLDAEVGDQSYTVFLTADHGAVETPLYLQNFEIPSGYFRYEQFKSGMNEYLSERFGDRMWIRNISNDQVFIDHEVIKERKKNKDEIIDAIIEFSLAFEGIQDAISAEQLHLGTFAQHHLAILQKGFHHRRSGDVILLLEPGWITYFRQGTTHGSTYNYDTHIPLIFYGKGIPKGQSFTKVQITDIAPTLAAFLRIQPPNGTTGHIITELFR